MSKIPLFIYVFNKEDSDAMKNAGYRMIQSNDDMGVYVFENRSELEFSCNVKHYYSNVLTFGK